MSEVSPLPPASPSLPAGWRNHPGTPSYAFGDFECNAMTPDKGQWSSCSVHPMLPPPRPSQQPMPLRKSHLPSPLKRCVCQMYGSCGHSNSGEEPEHSTGRESHVKNALLPS